MNKKEAIRAMLDGKGIRLKEWNSGCYVYYDDTTNTFRNSTDNRYNINVLSDTDDWEVYEEPKPKRKFYRRTWVINDVGSRLQIPVDWYISKELFDDRWNGWQLSPDWEEMEVSNY